jgi:hypothetical protein
MYAKTLSNLLFLIFLCFSFNILLAQPPQFQRQLNNIQFNSEIRMQSQMMMQMMNMPHVTASKLEYNFEVFLRDSTKLEVTSGMYTDSVTKRHFIVIVDKKFKKSDTNRYKKIYPAQTLYIQRNIAIRGPVLIHNNIKAPPPVYYKGAANDTCWMFKVLSGAINVYSFSGEEDGLYFDEASIVAIQLNNGPILNFNEENLKLMVGDDINSLESIKKKSYFKAIKKFNKDAEKAAKK